MSLAKTKEQFVRLLSDNDNKVIALSGKWGTGKSHLWREVKAQSKDEKVKSSIYISLFGLSNMDQVKLKIVQNAIPNAEENPARWESLKKAWSATSKILESIHKGFSALNEITLLAVPKILKDRVIVLDDIERKHSKLDVDEILGFVDEFTQQHGARIIIILNSDKLSDQIVWNTFREKVIDQEIELTTTPAEAFHIATQIVSSPYSSRLKDVIEACGIANIRIICKILRAVNIILNRRTDLSENTLIRVIPSTALLAAIHYKGIENGPDFDFVLRIGASDGRDWGKSREELDEDGKWRVDWRLKIRALGIQSCDEYEQIVVDFLKSGLFDATEVDKIIDRYSSEEEAMRAHRLIHQFREHRIWHYRIPESDLVEEARALIPMIHMVDIHNISGLHRDISELAGGQPVADELLDRWIEEFRKKTHGEIGEIDNYFGGRLHPRIKNEIDALKAASTSKFTIYDACWNIEKNSGWGNKEKTVLRNATAEDFESTIESLEVDDLKFFLCKCIDLCVHRSTYDPAFGTATQRFIDACRKICADPERARLSYLIKLLFEDAQLSDQLNPLTSSPLTPAAPGTR